MAEPVQPVFCRGDHTLRVPMELHTLNRRRLVQRLRARSDLPPKSVVILQGGESSTRYSADTEDVFRQESYFHWAFGVQEPDYYGAIDVLNGRSYLFVPQLPDSYAVWLGKLHNTDFYRDRHCVDEVYYTNEIAHVLHCIQPDVLLTLRGVNTDSCKTTLEAAFDGIADFKVNNTVLFPEITECRVIKTPLELEVLRFANQVSSKAHIQVMKKIRPGMKEYMLESIFQHYCSYYGGMRFMSYTCICASGANGAIVHYGHAGAPNDKVVSDSDMCVFDMGGEYYCYASDITCSYPVNGKFTPDQRAIYETVLKANRAVFKEVKPGVSWLDMHELAEMVILRELVNIGVLRGDIEDLISANMGSVFMPHGLGHFMGCDVHDVGGYPDWGPERPQRPGARSLRTCRLLQQGMVLTIEPGLYFIDTLLEQALRDPLRRRFFVTERLEQFRSFGGIRIEDCIVVTEDGAELMTQVPRSIEEIEKVMTEGRLDHQELPRAIMQPAEAILSYGYCMQMSDDGKSGKHKLQKDPYWWDMRNQSVGVDVEITSQIGSDSSLERDKTQYTSSHKNSFGAPNRKREKPKIRRADSSPPYYERDITSRYDAYKVASQSVSDKCTQMPSLIMNTTTSTKPGANKSVQVGVSSFLTMRYPDANQDKQDSPVRFYSDSSYAIDLHPRHAHVTMDKGTQMTTNAGPGEARVDSTPYLPKRYVMDKGVQAMPTSLSRIIASVTTQTTVKEDLTFDPRVEDYAYRPPRVGAHDKGRAYFDSPAQSGYDSPAEWSRANASPLRDKTHGRERVPVPHDTETSNPREARQDSLRVSPRNDTPRESTRDSPRDGIREYRKDAPRSPKDNSRDSPRESPRESRKESQRESFADSFSPRRENITESPRDNSKDSPRESSRNSRRESPRESRKESQRENIADSLSPRRENFGENPREGGSRRESIGDSRREIVGDSQRESVGDSRRDSPRRDSPRESARESNAESPRDSPRRDSPRGSPREGNVESPREVPNRSRGNTPERVSGASSKRSSRAESFTEGGPSRHPSPPFEE